MIHSQLERLKTEGVVDVFQAVKSARIQRPGIMPNIVCPVIATNYQCKFINSTSMYFYTSAKK